MPYLKMMQHINQHFIQFVPHTEHRIVYPVLRPELLVVEQSAK